MVRNPAHARHSRRFLLTLGWMVTEQRCCILADAYERRSGMIEAHGARGCSGNLRGWRASIARAIWNGRRRCRCRLRRLAHGARRRHGTRFSTSRCPLLASLAEGERGPVAHPPSRVHSVRCRRRSLGPGCSAAPERLRLALLPPGPDAVRRLPSRGTWPSTLTCASPYLEYCPLEREFSPAVADCGFREPLAPRLARPGMTILAAAASALALSSIARGA